VDVIAVRVVDRAEWESDVRFSGKQWLWVVVMASLARAAAAQDSTVHADEDPGYQVSILPVHVEADDMRGADTGFGAEVSFGRYFGRKLAFEVLVNYVTFETDTDGTDFYRVAVGLDAIYSFRARGTTPFVSVGAGLASNDVFPDENDDSSAFAHAGLGILSRPLGSYGVRFRAEARYAVDWVWEDPQDIQILAGVVIPLRKIPTRTVEIERVIEKTVYIEREPALPPLPPADTDGDGVVDGVDKCPGTLPGATVDEFGCVREKTIVQLPGVHFELNSAELTLDSRPLVAAAAATLRGQPGLRVQVAGHTDSQGTDLHNLSLSKRRAASVVDALVAEGIARERLTSEGYGEAEPFDTNATADGRARNRRVELRVLSN
jgi:OmpA-OmpF porin, OOP family